MDLNFAQDALQGGDSNAHEHHTNLTQNQENALIIVMCCEVAVYGIMGLLALWNVYFFLIKQKYFKNVFAMSFYFLALTVIVARSMNLIMEVMYRKDA